MGKNKPSVFLSYSRKDLRQAAALDKALKDLGLHVWRDMRSVSAGERFFYAIEEGVRAARAVVVLLTEASARSEWVTYEYALATGARVPVIAVVGEGVNVPAPIQQFQVVKYSTASRMAKQIREGIQTQSRQIGRIRTTEPKLVAKFLEDDGNICRASGGRIPELFMELWVEHVPLQTKSVSFEILDIGFEDGQWTKRRARRSEALPREFLTDDMSSYGDVEIWARGKGETTGNWSTTSRLYEALVRFYDGRPQSAEVRRALIQIRDN